MKLQVEKPQTPSYLKPLLIVVLLVGAILIGVQFIPKSSVPLSFEVTNFEGDVKIYDLKSRSWRVPKRGEDFRTSQKVKTGPDGQINLQVENEIQLRLKNNSELENKQSAVVGKQEVYKLKFGQGVLFGVTTKVFDRKKAAKKAVFQIATPRYDVDVLGSVFRLETAATQGKSWVGVLRGSVEVSAPSLFFHKGGIRIRGLEQASIIDGVVQPAVKVSQEEWGTLKEAYELREKTAVKEAEQIDLSRHAGSLFEYVFDHGTFFTPKVGFAGREFYKDPDSGEVYLDVEYDVFPVGSFVGVYIKTRNFDAAKYEGFSFEVRRNPEEGVPENFYIELKSKGNVVRRFSPRGFERTWKKMEFDFHAQKSTPVSEVVLVFTNSRVGEAKKGVLELRHFDLIPRKTPLPVPLPAPVKAAVKNELKPAAPSPVKPAAVTPKPAVKPAAKTVTVISKDQLLAVPKEVPLQ